MSEPNPCPCRDCQAAEKLAETVADLARVTAERDAARDAAREYRELWQRKEAASQARCAALEKERDEWQQRADACLAETMRTQTERDQLRQQLEGLEALCLKSILKREAEAERLRGASALALRWMGSIQCDDKPADWVGQRDGAMEVLELALSLTPLTALSAHDAEKDAVIEQVSAALRKLDSIYRTELDEPAVRPEWLVAALAATSEKEGM